MLRRIILRTTIYVESPYFQNATIQMKKETEKVAFLFELIPFNNRKNKRNTHLVSMDPKMVMLLIIYCRFTTFISTNSLLTNPNKTHSARYVNINHQLRRSSFPVFGFKIKISFCFPLFLRRITVCKFIRIHTSI